MDRDEIISMLRSHEDALRHRGVWHVALFGSMARREAEPGSDIDIMVEINSAAGVGVFEYVAITQYIADLFPARVDVAHRSRLKPLIRPNVERDAIFAF